MLSLILLIQSVHSQFGVPYTQQDGPTRYAPMLGLPSSFIVGGGTPYPTSAFAVFTEAVGPPNAITTTTMPVTYVITKLENTVPPASTLAKRVWRG